MFVALYKLAPELGHRKAGSRRRLYKQLHEYWIILCVFLAQKPKHQTYTYEISPFRTE